MHLVKILRFPKTKNFGEDLTCSKLLYVAIRRLNFLLYNTYMLTMLSYTLLTFPAVFLFHNCRIITWVEISSLTFCSQCFKRLACIADWSLKEHLMNELYATLLSNIEIVIK